VSLVEIRLPKKQGSGFVAEDVASVCEKAETVLSSWSCQLRERGNEVGADFLDQVDAVWSGVVFGISISHLLQGLLVLYIFIFIRSLFSKFVIAALKRLVRRSETTIDDQILGSLEGPLKLLPVIMGVFFGGRIMMGMNEEPSAFFSSLINQTVQSLIAYVIFWSLFNLVEPASHLFEKLERYLTDAMTNWMFKALKTIFALLGAAAILEIWGIPVGPLIASLGLFGVAVALGAQDLFKNLIGGLSILLERRYRTGDWVLVEGVVEGTVEAIGFRSTVIRRFDKAPVFVPNDIFSNSAVTNFSEMTHRRIYWKIGVEYRTTVDQLRQIRDQIEAYVHENEDFAPPQEVATFVRIDAFNDSAIDIMLYCFTKTTDWGQWLEIKEALAYRLKEIIEDAGSGFAFPSQSIYVESYPGEGPEIFVPPTQEV
jgi:MscS family membrane protein